MFFHSTQIIYYICSMKNQHHSRISFEFQSIEMREFSNLNFFIEKRNLFALRSYNFQTLFLFIITMVNEKIKHKLPVDSRRLCLIIPLSILLIHFKIFNYLYYFNSVRIQILIVFLSPNLKYNRCCRVCAKTSGESCGGQNGFSGTCEPPLQCIQKPSMEQSGTCMGKYLYNKIQLKSHVRFKKYYIYGKFYQKLVYLSMHNFHLFLHKCAGV